jgi:hypothetical protein
VPDVPDQDQVAQACAYLRMLLLRPGEYRSRWERWDDRLTAVTMRPADRLGTGIRYEAVAEVLQPVAYRLTGNGGDVSVTEAARRALEGVELSPPLADAFVDGFGLTARHAQRLRDLLQGVPTVRVISGDTLPPPGLAPPGPLHHETLSLHELHVLGPDGLPAEHETIQVVKATANGVASVPYRFDTDELMVEVIRGGRVGERPYRVTESIYGVDILLHRPLDAGQTALMQYRTTFYYKSPPPPEFRRAILRSTRDLTIWVKFHPRRVPAQVWRARWDRIDQARIVARETVEPDGELSVHHRFGAVEKAIVGFYWEWG